jgi:hypothetical protein
MRKEGTIIRERTPFNPLKLKTYLSVCVRYFNGVTKNHAAIIIYIDNEPYVFEAWRRVIITPLDKWFRPGYTYSFIEPFADYDAGFARHKALSMAGWTEYNFLGTMFYQLIYQVFDLWIGPKGDKANKKVQCAQFIAILCKKPSPWLWTPRNLDNGKL